MKRFWVLSCLLPIGATIVPALPAAANANCLYDLGVSSAGQTMQLDVCAIQLIPKTFNVDFRYSLDGEAIAATADCRTRSWFIPAERSTHKPQSQATIDMLQLVCTAPGNGNGDSPLAVVFNPPSNIRKKPNGPIIYTIPELRMIQISGSGPSGQWLRTSVDGHTGYIHSSQIKIYSPY
jgi:hypothetical protein